MPFLSYRKDNKFIEHKLDSDDTTVGRAHECTISIQNDTEISRFHCSVHRHVDGTYWVIDTASKNGTFLNGKRILNEEVQLKPGDIVRVGGTNLKFTKVSAYDTGAAFQEAEEDLEQGKGLNQALQEIVSQHKKTAKPNSGSKSQEE
ncbi:MAG: FHA domain-containing protein [Lentisphaeria bacterium]